MPLVKRTVVLRSLKKHFDSELIVLVYCVNVKILSILLYILVSVLFYYKLKATGQSNALMQHENRRGSTKEIKHCNALPFENLLLKLFNLKDEIYFRLS